MKITARVFQQLNSILIYIHKPKKNFKIRKDTNYTKYYILVHWDHSNNNRFGILFKSISLLCLLHTAHFKEIWVQIPAPSSLL